MAAHTRSPIAIEQPIAACTEAFAVKDQITKLSALLQKGSLAVTDQGLFSGANFAVNILFARWLTPAEYGAYSLAYSAFLLLAAIHSGLLIEPMMIFGAGKYFDRFAPYLRRVIAFHAAVLFPISVVLWIVAVALGRVYSPSTRHACEGLVIGSAFILLFWLLRRVFYVLMRPGWGVLSSALYFAALVGSAGALWFTHSLTPFSAFIGMGFASLVSSVLLFGRVAPRVAAAAPLTTFREVAVDHWKYGRWAVASAAVSWFPGHIYYSVLPFWLGLEGAGALRALTNFVMPVLQAIAALNMLLIPSLVRDRREGGMRQMNQTMLRFFALFCAGCVVYLAALWLFRAQVFQLFYGGQYKQFAGWPLLLVGLLPLSGCASAVLGNALRALERPDRMLWAYVASAASTVVIGIPCAMKFGVSGALFGIHCSSLALVATLLLSYWSFAAKDRRARGEEVV
jgi:O-antigen/teichoic acid export membrane protein